MSPEIGGWCVEEKARELCERLLGLSAAFARRLRCVELGVFEGKSLFIQAAALRSSPYGGRIVGIDPYTAAACAEGFDLADPFQAAHVEWWSALSLEQHEQRCRHELRERGLSPWCEVRTCLPEDVSADYHALDWLHLDDSHSPSVSLRNAETWVPKVVPGGLVVLDDIHYPTMQPAREWIGRRCELLSERAAGGMQWAFYRVA